MAQNPGNKIKKDASNISENVNETISTTEQAIRKRNSAIEDFKRSQQEALMDIIRESNEVQKFIDNTNEAIKNATRNGLDSDKLNAQLQANKDRLNALAEKKNRLTNYLEQAGQQEVIANAESELAEEELIEEYRRRARTVQDLNAQLKKANNSGNAAAAEKIKQQLSEAEASLEDPKLFNARAQAAQPTGRWLQTLPGGFSKYSGVANDIMDALAGKSKLEPNGSKPKGRILGVLTKILDVASAIRKPIDQFVNEAADVLSANVGRINAALEGTGRTYQDVTESMVESLGLNRYVQQTDYIKNIAQLTAAGITYNVEQRAILETIKEKTIASFSSMEGSLLRLVRLKQTDITANQFGMEAALRNTLNKVFKDSTYMKDMFDGISGAITDAVMVSGSKDVTEYSSVVQTWMGAMYESGIDSNMVTKMANAINALGSGNVSALASDQDMQRLILLSMDTIGMDYADILQQGLAPSDINDLLTAVVKYLSKIETNTKDNNVLQSSYTNLFGMSMADLQGFRNLKSKMGGLTSVNAGSARAVTDAEVAAVESTQRTIIAEQVNNALANARFTFGNSIAKDSSSYLSWKIANMTLDVAEQYLGQESTNKKNFKGKAMTQIGRAAQGVILANELKGVLSMIEALPSLFNSEDTGISFLLSGSGSSYSSEDNGSSGSGIGATLASAAGGAFKAVGSLWNKIVTHEKYQTAFQSYSSKEWEEEEEDQNEILSALESTMVVHNAEESRKAFATYLVGMTDDTLRSFASIFADEDAMADTFEGNNNVLKDNLFKYAEDTTSNSSDGNSGDADAGGADELD